jgi:hypothetical protein
MVTRDLRVVSNDVTNNEEFGIVGTAIQDSLFLHNDCRFNLVDGIFLQENPDTIPPLQSVNNAFVHNTCGSGPPGQVTVCHRGHTMTVGENALPAHLAHGDYLGPCEEERAGRPIRNLIQFRKRGFGFEEQPDAPTPLRPRKVE